MRGIFRPWLLAEFLDPDDVSLVMDRQQAFVAAFRAGSPDVDGVPDRVLDALVDNITLCGTLADLDSKVEKLQHYAQAGLGAISLRLYANPMDSIRLIGDKLVPALRDV